METKETGLALLDADRTLAIATKLKEIVESHKLYTPIKGKKYVWVEGWCLGGNRLGLTALPKTPIKLQGKDGEVIYGCEADIIKLENGQIIGHGYSICSNIEDNKKSWQEYAIASMSQTRAISRAYRNTIGFVMKLMGNEFVATPAEEMDFTKQDDTNYEDKPRITGKDIAAGLDKVSKTIIQSEATAIKTAIADYDHAPDFPKFCIDFVIGKVEELPASKLIEARQWVVTQRNLKNKKGASK